MLFKNFGYSTLSKIYHELEIDKFTINKFKNRNTNDCLTLKPMVQELQKNYYVFNYYDEVLKDIRKNRKKITHPI